MNSIKSIADLDEYLSTHSIEKGCMVDTSILFAASYPLDKFNEGAELAFNALSKNNIPVYTNVNIRSEFIELFRRVVIPEALIDFYDDTKQSLNPQLTLKLKSLQTRSRNAINKGQTFKLSDRDIKDFKFWLSELGSDEKDGWELFCQSYLTGRIQSIWDTAVDEWNLNFLSLRATEDHPLIKDHVNWESMISLVEQFGIGSMDAMILNLFRASDLNILLTADSDLTYCVQKLKLKNKVVFTPTEVIKRN